MLNNKNIIFCKKCVESNQRYIGSIAHLDQKSSNKKEEFKQRTDFSKEGIGSGCLFYEKKKNINWEEREKELVEILNRYRKSDGSYDVLVPGSGGKDSVFVSHILKNKYKMNPLSCTWAPHMYTDIGWRNFQSWINSGLDNILFTPNGVTHRKLTRLSFRNLLHAFQPFQLGQTIFPTRVAIEKNIKLIITGDIYADQGTGGNVHNDSYSLNPALFTYKDKKDLFFGGVPYHELEKYDISENDMLPYLPIEENKFSNYDIQTIGLPYFISYNPQSNYYYAKEHTNFEVNPDGRTEGTYTKYQSLDDKIDGLHHYTWFIKTGRGRATEDATLEIRNNIITREEGVALIKKYDGEFPKKYFNEILEYLDMKEDEFYEIIDSFRPDHIWKKENNKWKLINAVWK